MCGRFTQYNHRRLLARLHQLGLDEDDIDSPYYNLSPSQLILAVRRVIDHNEIARLRWGLIPSWAKDTSIGYKTINARCETIHEKPAFRSAFKHRRCLIPADGFYEWKQVKPKTPYFVYRADKEPMVFAGLWESWTSPEGEIIESCSIVTTEASEIIKPLHERMPVMVEPENFERWLDPAITTREKLEDLFLTPPSQLLALHPVSALVNSPRNQGPALIEAVEEPTQQGSLFPD
ncbi:SOS response-associated peptidase [Telmatocola sphagniphila]|uniref:Abasic site processing protein n=1 Tax=Telmatocola sphagniphila TaxID=1123043 RepID=A0A8E6B5K2_9BACT|nr:SOS response-associated peptidase [Telmatocola sphagniphila]QVL31551.1 SOS response-associated peptidase [Telmatocola sphagniphila]